MGGLTEHGIKKGFANQDFTTKCGFHHGEILAANMGDFTQRQLTNIGKCAIKYRDLSYLYGYEYYTRSCSLLSSTIAHRLSIYAIYIYIYNVTVYMQYIYIYIYIYLHKGYESCQFLEVSKWVCPIQRTQLGSDKKNCWTSFWGFLWKTAKIWVCLKIG